MENTNFIGVVQDYNARAFIGSVEIGTGLEMTAKIQNEVFKDIKFRSYGCQSLYITTTNFINKILCNNIWIALDKITDSNNNAIQKYSGCRCPENILINKLLNLNKTSNYIDSNIICVCKGLTRYDIENQILLNNLYTYKAVQNFFSLDENCNKCRMRILKILKRVIEFEKIIQNGRNKIE